MSQFKKWLKTQFNRYDASIDADVPNQSMTLTVNGPLAGHLLYTTK